MQSRVVSSTSSYVLTNLLQIRPTWKFSSVQPFATRFPICDKHATLAIRDIMGYSLSEGAASNRKSWHHAASPEDEALPEELADQNHTVIGQEALVNAMSTMRVKFMLQKACQFGERYSIVGSDTLFGNWDPKSGVSMEWSEGHNWSVEMDVPLGKRIEYKLILIRKNGNIEWQPDGNRYFETTDPTISSLVVSTPWDEEEEIVGGGTPEEADEETTEITLVAAARTADSVLSFGMKQLKSVQENLIERDTLVEGNGQPILSVDEEDKPETVPEISISDAILAKSILNAAETDEFQS